jgi:hypothetical protein
MLILKVRYKLCLYLPWLSLGCCQRAVDGTFVQSHIALCHMQYHLLLTAFAVLFPSKRVTWNVVKMHATINEHYTPGEHEYSTTSDRIWWRSTQGLRQVVTSLQVCYRMEPIKKYNAWKIECTWTDITIFFFCRRQSRKRFLFVLRNVVWGSVV